MERSVMKIAMFVLAASMAVVKLCRAARENNLKTADYYFHDQKPPTDEEYQSVTEIIEALDPIQRQKLLRWLETEHDDLKHHSSEELEHELIADDYFLEQNPPTDEEYQSVTKIIEALDPIQRQKLLRWLKDLVTEYYDFSEELEDELTLGDYFIDKNKLNLQEWLEYDYALEHFYFPPTVKKNRMVNEIIQYIQLIKKQIILRFLKDFKDITKESISEDLNLYCLEFLEDLRDELTNSTCVRTRLNELLLSTLENAADAIMEKCSHLCTQKNLTFCSTAGCSCALGNGQQLGQLLKKYVREENRTKVNATTLGDFILNLLKEDLFSIPIPFNTAAYSWKRVAKVMSIAPSVEMFGYENLLSQLDYNYYISNENTTVSDEKITWGVVESNTGTFHLPCYRYGDVYSRNSSELKIYNDYCDPAGVIPSIKNLLRCASNNSSSLPLAWSTIPTIYVHSQCLCLAYWGKDCEVKAPLGIDNRTYCLSVLLRDFQRRVSYRPAATYLDYAFMTPIPVCKLTQLLQLTFDFYCNDKYEYSQPVICYFKGLFNKEINCTQRLILNTTNVASLCDTVYFMRLVVCKDGAEYNKPVFYYRLGDSTLVLILTYVDLGLRLLTLFTYLACTQLRNLPGKLFMGYQLTALIRLLVVRAILEDLQFAVRLDVSMDLASTMWLTAYLHFLTMSIRTLRLPDSLSRREARMVLLRYSLFGCALPAVLSVALFTMDETLEGHVQVGQLMFVLCSYVALFANLLMLYLNFKVYFEIRSNARQLQRHVKARQIFVDLFNFALKTSVLSGAGILFRLIFTQIPNLVYVISYYHVLGTFHGLLLFLLYGCNREARVFWLSVWRSILSRCHLRRNTSLGNNSLELEQRTI